MLPNFDTSPLSDRQIALFKKIGNYQLPAQSLPPPENVASGLLTTAMNATYNLALDQGLIADASDIENNMMVVGRREQGRQMLLALKFYLKEDGGVGIEEAHSWTMGDSWAGERMRQRFMSTLVNGK